MQEACSVGVPSTAGVNRPVFPPEGRDGLQLHGAQLSAPSRPRHILQSYLCHFSEEMQHAHRM